MVDIWLPGYTRVNLGWAGAPYDATSRPKLLWHTTEGTSIAGARNAFRAYPPHCCYDPWTDQTPEQYVPLNRHAYALAGAESDDEYVIQVEVVGFAGQSHTWPDHVLERLGRRVAAPIAAAVGVPPQHLRFYRADEGIVLASKTSPIRLSDSAFRAFAGHLGHQHAPAPDQHWDPGGLPIDRILTYAQEDDMYTDDDRRMAQSMAHRVEALAKALNTATGGPDAGEAIPMVTILEAAAWRLHRALQLDPTLSSGIPLVDNGESLPLVDLLHQLAADVAELKARPVADVDEAALAAALEARGWDGVTVDEVKEVIRAAFARAGQPEGGTP